ncbi:hypothetical protein FH972_004824 [Carpinus fangiana]|uniref:Uncharacterized protein n=1 Tax=Carpinus fangiana TaxID=176857 RepID=A0A5N6QQV3_9ROSI|nr:hypothetical protein FH972_004824 [Carpinus fangiana]
MAMVLTGTSHPAFLFHKLTKGVRRGDHSHEWIKQNCTLIDPKASNESEQQHMRFTNAIGFRGEFYALNLQGTLAVIEDIDSLLKINYVGKRRAAHSVSSKLFLISKKYVHVVDDSEVFGLILSDSHGLRWRAFKIEQYFWEIIVVSVSASKVGCSLQEELSI